MIHKLVYRIYRAEGLTVRRKARKKLTGGERLHKPVVCAANQRWSMDFMSDQLASGSAPDTCGKWRPERSVA